MRCHLAFLLPAAGIVLLAAGCGPKGALGGKSGNSPTAGEQGVPIGDKLNMTVVPYEAADKLSEEYQPMADWLAKRVGKPDGKFVTVMDYAGVLAALQSGQVDVAYLSPFPYALATVRMKLHPLAMPFVKNRMGVSSLTYRGIIFVRAGSPIKTVQDLKGRTFAFGDPASTSGYLLPRALLEKQGVFGALKKWYSAGDANAVVLAVEKGSVDAGAAYENVFEVAYRETPEKAKGMRIIAETEEIPNGIYVARGDMPSEEVEKLKQAFLDMNTDAAGRAIMLRAPNEKIVPADDRLFDHVRDAAKILHLDLKALEKK